MNFIVAEVKALKDRELDEFTLLRGDKATVSAIEGGDKNKTLKLWGYGGQYEDLQKYHDIDNPILIIKSMKNENPVCPECLEEVAQEELDIFGGLCETCSGNCY